MGSPSRKNVLRQRTSRPADGLRTDGRDLFGGPLAARKRCQPVHNRAPSRAEARADIDDGDLFFTVAAERERDTRSRWPGADDQRGRHSDRTGCQRERSWRGDDATATMAGYFPKASMMITGIPPSRRDMFGSG